MINKQLSMLLFSILFVAALFITVQFMTMTSSSIDQNINVSTEYEDTYEVNKDMTNAGIDILTVVVFVIAVFILIAAFKFLK